jgi:uncharacterized membrane protein
MSYRRRRPPGQADAALYPAPTRTVHRMTPIRMTLVLHIVAGTAALVTGFIALYAAKGGRTHRRIGMAFVYAMLTMCGAAVVLAAWRGGAWSWVNLRAGVLTAYLVLTSLTTVRPPVWKSRWLDVGGMVVAVTLGTISLTFGVEAIAIGGRRDGVPAFPFFLFGIVGLLAAAGDLRVIRDGALKGIPRLVRHLWRMTFALLIAAMSFFFGQAKVIPKPIRIMPLLALPVLAILVTLLYWLWRVRPRRGPRALVGLRLGR